MRLMLSRLWSDLKKIGEHTLISVFAVLCLAGFDYVLRHVLDPGWAETFVHGFDTLIMVGVMVFLGIELVYYFGRRCLEAFSGLDLVFA